MSIINFICDIINSSWLWLTAPFFLGWTWIAKTAADDVLCSHINDLQTKKVDTDWKDYKARAYLSGDQSNIVDDTITKVLLDAETYDPGGAFDADGVDSEYIAPVSGYYLIKGQIHWTAAAAGTYRSSIYIEGAEKSRGNIKVTAEANYFAVPVSDVLYVAQGESIDLRARHNAGVDTPDIVGDEKLTFLTIHIQSI